VDHYRARMPRRAGRERRPVGLSLYQDDWERIDKRATEKEWSVSMVVSQIVTQWLTVQSEQEAARGPQATDDLLSQGGDEVFLV